MSLNPNPKSLNPDPHSLLKPVLTPSFYCPTRKRVQKKSMSRIFHGEQKSWTPLGPVVKGGTSLPPRLTSTSQYQTCHEHIPPFKRLPNNVWVICKVNFLQNSQHKPKRKPQNMISGFSAVHPKKTLGPTSGGWVQFNPVSYQGIHTIAFQTNLGNVVHFGPCFVILV